MIWNKVGFIGRLMMTGFRDLMNFEGKFKCKEIGKKVWGERGS